MLAVGDRGPRASRVEDLLQETGKLVVQTGVNYRIVADGGFGQQGWEHGHGCRRFRLEI